MLNKPIRMLLLVVLILGVSAWVCYRGINGPPQIKIINNSSSELATVVLSGERWSQPILNISPGKAVTVLVHPKGESDLRISFVCSGKSTKKEDLDYIEPSGGYCVTVTVDEGLNVRSPGGIGCFSLKRAVYFPKP